MIRKALSIVFLVFALVTVGCATSSSPASSTNVTPTPTLTQAPISVPTSTPHPTQTPLNTPTPAPLFTPTRTGAVNEAEAIKFAQEMLGHAVPGVTAVRDPRNPVAWLVTLAEYKHQLGMVPIGAVPTDMDANKLVWVVQMEGASMVSENPSGYAGTQFYYALVVLDPETGQYIRDDRSVGPVFVRAPDGDWIEPSSISPPEARLKFTIAPGVWIESNSTNSALLYDMNGQIIFNGDGTVYQCYFHVAEGRRLEKVLADENAMRRIR
ncbi:MAG: hypothetical protein FJ320_07950 [SAR202 cluster bacterium]|nr:hypothetical protein [SAR202 cluster bacterium]